MSLNIPIKKRLARGGPFVFSFWIEKLEVDVELGVDAHPVATHGFFFVSKLCDEVSLDGEHGVDGIACTNLYLSLFPGKGSMSKYATAVP